MDRVAEIIVTLGLDPRTGVTFAEELEASLDCSHCQRTRRTVTFKLESGLGRCSPGSGKREGEAHPPFPGLLVDRRVERGRDGAVVATYRLEYDAAPFVDLKYGDRSPWHGYPTWARVSFKLACPTCGLEARQSVQSNIVRPYERRCSCDFVLYVERREMPILRYVEPATGQWLQVPERFGAE